MSKPDFRGLNVLVLKSRRSREMAALVTTYDGRPVVAPALREVPIESNTEALAFADALIRNEFDLVILLTGVGTRALLGVVHGAGRRDGFVAALGRTKVAVRGPKPLGVIRELGVPAWVTAPEPKSKRSRRSVVLPGVVKTALKAHRVYQLQERLVSGSQWHESGLVFTTRQGKPLDARNVTREFHALLAKAGLPRIRFHDLRHTAATLLLAQGVSPRTIMETLGHSQISLTMDTYTHVLPALQHDAAKQMDAALGTDS